LSSESSEENDGSCIAGGDIIYGQCEEKCWAVLILKS
jgi:hypothetical protein